MKSALILLLPVVAFAIDCPEGWMGIHGSCYLVIAHMKDVDIVSLMMEMKILMNDRMILMMM